MIIGVIKGETRSLDYGSNVKNMSYGMGTRCPR